MDEPCTRYDMVVVMVVDDARMLVVVGEQSVCRRVPEIWWGMTGVGQI